MLKDKLNILGFAIVLLGLVVLGMGCIKILEAKFGTLTSMEHENCANFTRDLAKNHSEYLKFDPEPYSTCKDGVLKRNYFEGLKLVIIGGIIILGGYFFKFFFNK